MDKAAVASISSGDHLARVNARRDELVEKHFGLVPPIARRVHRRVPPSFDLDDLISEGNIGLMQAASRYDPGRHRGTPFSAYARTRIHGAIVDSVRRRAWSDNTTLPLEDAPEPTFTPSLPFLITGGAHEAARSRPGRRTAGFRAELLPKRLAAAVKRLPARQRAILGAFCAEAGSLGEIAELLGLSTAQVYSEYQKAILALRAAMARDLSIVGSTLNSFPRVAIMPKGIAA